METNNRDIKTGLLALIIVILLIFLIGLFINIPEPVSIQGEAVASELRISGKVPGRIHAFRVEEGMTVKEGDTLVELESPELSAKLEQANAAKQAAQAQSQKAIDGASAEMIKGAYEMYQKAKVGVDITKKSFERTQHLFEKGIVSAQKRDEVEAQYKAAVATENAAKAQYEMAKNGANKNDKVAAEALVQRAKGAINEVKSYMSETTLTSPIDGEVSEIFPKRGELVGTGAPIMNIVDLKNIWFSFNIREDMLKDFKIGKQITVQIPALDNKEFVLKISYMKAMASYATWKATKTTGQFDVKTFELRAKPIHEIADLRPGMSAIIIESK